MTVFGKQLRMRFAFFSRAAVVLAVVLGALFSATASAQIFFSPYKDVTINTNWNTGEQQSAVTGTVEAVTSAMPNSTLTWAFATGTCGSENWGGISSAMEATNAQDFVNAGKRYVLSTGGADGTFDCPSNSGMQTFINHYYSANMAGVDYDIEGGQSQGIIDDLINSTKYAEGQYPNMRFSFTVATLGAATTGSDLNSLGDLVMSEISRLGLGGNYYVDLMAFDYGGASSGVCVVSGVNCDMAQSAIAAAESLHSHFGTPYSHIELCLMIGQADSGATETLSLANVDTLVAWGKSVGLGGFHFWSFDRDQPSGSSSATGDGTGNPPLAYANRFDSDLGGSSPPPPPPPPPPPTTEAPYGGTPAAIPGTVLAEKYDTGGQGLAFNVTAVNGTDNGFRSDGVDLETASAPATGNDLGWTAGGQWFKYTVNVATPGTYTVSMLVASPAAIGDAFHISNSSGTNLSGSVAVPATGGFQVWATVKATVTLPAGTQTLTVNQDAAGWNIDSLAFATSGAPPPPPPPPPGEAPYGGTAAAIPGTVLAEKYDTGGQGVAYNVTAVNGTDNGFRSDGVDLETTSAPGGGNNIGWTAAGQWFRYTVNVATAGTYTVSLVVASPAAVGDAFHISNSSGTNLSGSVAVPATGGFQVWVTVKATVTLPAGTQTLTVNQDNAGWNIYSLAFAASGAPPPPPPTGGSVTLNPASFNFGSTTPGAGTSWVTFTLTNGGSSAVSISSVNVTGAFVVSSSCGSSVAANSSCPIYVYFAPTAAGSFTGTLTVNDNGSNSPQTTALSGTGS
jgi:hypothetical protein